MKRHVVSTVLALVAVTGCTGDNAPSPSASGSGTKSVQASDAPCAAARAKDSRQVLLSPSGFSETCVKTTVGAQFFFINDSAKPQSVKTAVGASEAFQVDLPKKTSTYARSFKKKGSYSIQTGDGKATLTLLVE